MSVSYRRYEAGDETAIVELYREVFAIPYSMERWLWQYAQPPEAQRREIFLAFDGPTLVGHASTVPLRLSGALGSLCGAHSQDAFVRSESRGSGIFKELLRRLEELQCSNKVDLVVGHPNPRSFPVMTGVGGYEHLFDLYPYSLDLAVLTGPYNKSASVAVSASPAFTDADTQFLERQLSHYGIRGARTREWLEWRYHPDCGKRYRVVRAREGGELVAFAVVKEYAEGGCIDLLEFVVGEDEPLVRSVLRTIGSDYRERGLSKVSLWSMGHYSLHGHLLNVGFEREERRTHFIARALRSPPDLRWREPAQYYVSMGDSDVY